MHPFLGAFLLCYVLLAPCEVATYLILSAHSLLPRKYIAHPALHVLPWIIFPFYHLLEKLHLSSAPKSPGKDIHQHRPVFPLRCLSMLVPLIKPHRFLFIKIMPWKPWILSEVHIQQNAKEEQRHTEGMHWRNVQMRLPIFIQKSQKMHRHKSEF